MERWTVLQGYARSVANRIVCVQANESRVPHQSEIQIDLLNFVDLDNCLKSVLIVENAESDASFYLAAAKELHSFGSLLPALSFEVVAGGGQTTANRIKAAVALVRPSLAIVDGDRTHPASPEGGTAKAARLAFRSPAGAQHRLVVTTVRALENFIPYSAAHRFLDDPISLSRAEKLSSWQSVKSHTLVKIGMCPTAFYGPRKGMKVKAYRTAPDAFKGYVDELCKHLGEPFVAPANDDDSSDQKYAILPLSKDYAGLFLEAIGLTRFSTVLKDVQEHPFYAELQFICQLILAFGAAPIKSAARAAA